MRDRPLQQRNTLGNTHRAIALDAVLADKSLRRSDSSQPRQQSDHSDPIRGLRNGLIISIAMWATLYFIIQLILR